MGCAMMIGVAQVIGMKPTLRSFFSMAPPCANTSVAVRSGKTCESAASAVEAPTALRKLRRAASCGNTARMTAEATTPWQRSSSLSLSTGVHWSCRRASYSCSASLRCRPQAQPARASRRLGSNGLSKVDMGKSSIAAPAATGTTSTDELAMDVPVLWICDGPRFALLGRALRSEAASVSPLLGQSLNFRAGADLPGSIRAPGAIYSRPARGDSSPHLRVGCRLERTIHGGQAWYFARKTQENVAQTRDESGARQEQDRAQAARSRPARRSRRRRRARARAAGRAGVEGRGQGQPRGDARARGLVRGFPAARRCRAGAGVHGVGQTDGLDARTSHALGGLPLPSWGEGGGEGVTELSRGPNPLTPSLSPSGRGSLPRSWRRRISPAKDKVPRRVMDTAWAHASEIAAAVGDGSTSAAAVIDAALARIAAHDRVLTAFTAMLAERARTKAAAIDAARAQGRALGALAGVPFAVKNLFDVEGLPTLAGSKINRARNPAAHDATVIQRLEAQDAVLVGALNMGEYAYDFTGENVHYGASRNPHDTTRMTGGSSGGSGGAVGGGLVPLALGSDTN